MFFATLLKFLINYLFKVYSLKVYALNGCSMCSGWLNDKTLVSHVKVLLRLFHFISVANLLPEIFRGIHGSTVLVLWWFYNGN